MAHGWTCDDVAEREVVARYVAGTIEADEAAGFETHYLGCARCQREVKLALAIRDAAKGSAMPRASDPMHRRRGGRWPIAIVAGLAATFAGVVIWSATATDTLADLGAVLEPPVYLGVPVRERNAQGDSAFAAAMSAYTDGRYEVAAAALDRALAAGTDSVPALFFRAASHLMLGRHRDAAEGFERVMAAGDSPYRAESMYLRAKALLRDDRGADALELLRDLGALSTTAGMPDLSRAASALADSIENRQAP